MAGDLGSAFIEIRANLETLSQDLSQARTDTQTAAAALQAEVERMSEAMEQSMRGVQNSTNQMTNTFQSSSNRVSESTQQISNAMRAADRQFNAAFQELGSNMASFGTDTEGLIDRVTELGNAQRAAADQAINANARLRGELLQQIGTVLAASNSFDKLNSILQAHGGAIHALSGPFMRLGAGIENIARQGAPAVVALREVGPQASNKQLLDMIRNINAGLMRFQSVAMISGIAALGMVTALIKLSNTVDGRLIPAGEQFKATWLKALEPLAKAVTEFFLVIIKAGTAVGEFMVKVKEFSPILAGMITGFVALAPIIALILSPLAVGVSTLGSFRAAFHSVFMLIKPFVAGFLTIAGPVILVTGLLVTLIGFFTKLTKESEAFRAAVSDAWNQVKAAAQTAFAPIAGLIDQLKQSFINMVAALTGAAPQATSIWDAIGAAVGKFVTFFANTAMPLFKTAFQAASLVLQAAIKILIIAFNGISDFWSSHGPAIKAIVSEVFQAISAIIQGAVGIIQEAFKFIMQAIAPLMPLLKTLGTTVFGVIGQIISDFLKGSEGMGGFGDKVQTVVDFVSNSILPILQTAFQNASIIIGTIIEFLIAAFNKISEFWANHGPTIISMVQKVGSFLMSVFQDAADFIGIIAPQIAQIVKTAFEVIKQVIEFVMPLILGLIQTVFPAILAIIKAVMPIIQAVIIDTWNFIKLGIQGALNIIQGIVGAFSALLKGDWSALWENIKLILSGAWDLIVSLFNLFIFGKIFKIFKLFGKSTGDLFTRLWNAIKSKIDEVWNAISTKTSSVWNAIKTFFTNIWNGIKTEFTNALNSIKALIGSIWDAIKAATSAVWNIIKSALVAVWNAIKAAVTSVWNGIKTITTTIWNAVKAFLSTIFNNIKTNISNQLNAIKSFITTIWNAIKSVTSTVWNGIKSLLTGIWNGIKSLATSVWNGIKSFLSSAWNSIKSTASSAFNSIKSTVTGIWNNLQSIVTNAANNISNRVKGAFNNLRGAMSGIWGGIVSAIKSTLNGGIRALNRFISGVNNAIRKLNRAPGVNLPTVPSIPFLAEGGDILSRGLAIVGEAGPELLELPRGARVSPLGRGAEGATGAARTVQLIQNMEVKATPEELQRYVERGLRKIIQSTGLLL